MKRTWGLVAVGLSGACVVAACGGGSAQAPSSVTPAGQGEGAPPPSYPPAVPQATTGVTPTDEPQPHNGAVQPRPPPPVDNYRSNARDELNRAEAQIAAAPKDCMSACRALASMERAAKSLCDLGGADECSQARARVEAARDRVRSSCGSCPSSR